MVDEVPMCPSAGLLLLVSITRFTLTNQRLSLHEMYLHIQSHWVKHEAYHQEPMWWYYVTLAIQLLLCVHRLILHNKKFLALWHMIPNRSLSNDRYIISCGFKMHKISSVTDEEWLLLPNPYLWWVQLSIGWACAGRLNVSEYTNIYSISLQNGLFSFLCLEIKCKWWKLTIWDKS